MNEKEEYWKFAESEKHFNDIQAGVRNLASAWMLAAFGAIALLMKSGGDAKWLVQPSVLIGVVSGMATLGLLVLWILDQLVYERLLNSVFLVALKKEWDNHDLPPTRCMMLYSTCGRGMSRWMVLFYVIPMVVFGIISLAAFLMREKVDVAGPGGGDGWSPGILIAVFLVQVGAIVWVWWQTGSVKSSGRAGVYNNTKFSDLFSKERKKCLAALEEEIRKHSPPVGGNVKTTVAVPAGS